MFSMKDKGDKIEFECNDCGQTEEMPKMMIKDMVTEEELL